MSHIKTYLEKSILIPPNIKTSISTEEMHITIEEDVRYFMETYAPLEKEILSHVNKELEMLNIQIKSYIQSKEMAAKAQEISEIEQEIAYL